MSTLLFRSHSAIAVTCDENIFVVIGRNPLRPICACETLNEAIASARENSGVIYQTQSDRLNGFFLSIAISEDEEDVIVAHHACDSEEESAAMLSGLIENGYKPFILRF